MMNDQPQGAELDAAVATAMGKQPRLRPDAKGTMHCMVPYPQDCAPDAMVAFRPSRGGAAAWEAFCFGADRWGFLRFTSLMDSIMTAAAGNMDWAECACRAVVALGETR